MEIVFCEVLPHVATIAEEFSYTGMSIVAEATRNSYRERAGNAGVIYRLQSDCATFTAA